ncbi:hypothetical protein [Oscillibacter ruminantium]|uniref:hypothetical protein n=1 Tax=Oscillibacter ruminantium TaxID=1263547 RepID=UPI000313D0D7|nr:hypothetical protein [Oscillibacter ruminantium]
MKLKQIASLCKDSGRIILYDRTDSEGVVSQWIGDGFSCYPLEGLPYMEMDHIVNVFELTEKQQEKMLLRHEKVPVNLNLSDADQSEIHADQGIFTLNYGGYTIAVLRTSHGMYYVQQKYILPLIMDLQGVEIYKRTDGHIDYFAVKFGLMLVGIVLPYVGFLNDQFADSMESIARDIRAKVDQRKNIGIIQGGAEHEADL